MRRLLSLGLLAWLCACLPAQERLVTVTLDDGRVVSGRVMALDLGSLQIQVGDRVEAVSALRIQSCVFAKVGEPAGEVAAGESGPEPVGAPAEPPPAASATAPPKVAPQGLLRQRALPQTLEDPAELRLAEALDPATQPHDLRNRPLWRQRLEDLDQAYPWLCPTAPIQWVSLGSLLFVLLSLFVHASVRIAGLHQAGISGSMLMALWYLAAGLLQFCLVPSGDLALLATLVGNAALACFWLRQIYGLTRSATVVAFVVQIGFVALALGVVQFADSVLRSVRAGHA